ncbi:Thioesterase domain [Dillenia turbinata]|uniref:Thioesterase domain n=1 Tax=Dillenia turbinata TaxID=194707 RepID=A0AAN8Z0U1_9MAGN
MAKSSESISTATISSELSPSIISQLELVFSSVKVNEPIPEFMSGSDSYSDLVRGILKLDQVQRGRLSCLLTVKPFVSNIYGHLHGGAVAATAEVVAVACARTVVGEEKELFLGELGMTYLSSAPANAEVIVEASIVRRGRNLTVISVEFRLKGTTKLVYTARVTFYHMPVAKL